MTAEQPGELVVDLLEVAVRAEGRGQLNIGKVVRAAAAAVARRAAARSGFPNDARGIVADLRQLSRRVAEAGLGEAAAARIALGAELVASGEQSCLDRFPDPCVCRRCGILVESPPNDACERCGAHPLTFERFRPVYWLTVYQPREVLERLARNPDLFVRAVQRVHPGQLNRAAPAGGWSAIDVLRHVRDADSVLARRVDLILEEDDPVLEFQPVFAWTDEAPATGETAEDVLKAYAASRAATVLRLESLGPDEWRRTGRHEEFGKVTMCEQASYFAAHELIHLRQIEQIRRTIAADDSAVS